MTQSSFSTEWLTVRDDDLTFTYTHRDREDFIRIELDRAPTSRKGGTLLDIGCGYGTEARCCSVSRAWRLRHRSQPVAARQGPSIDREPLVHTVITSLFALPFPRREFDVVYSHGVLHHTFSTSAAFASIADYVAPGGTLSIWVYAKADFEGSRRLRLSAGVERVFRPVVAAAPKRVQSAVTHALSVPHFLRYRLRGMNREQWRFKNSLHSMRDRWTPRYAHRHEPAEVEGWFRAQGFAAVPTDAASYERRFGIPLIGIGGGPHAVRTRADRPIAPKTSTTSAPSTAADATFAWSSVAALPGTRATRARIAHAPTAPRARRMSSVVNRTRGSETAAATHPTATATKSRRIEYQPVTPTTNDPACETSRRERRPSQSRS